MDRNVADMCVVALAEPSRRPVLPLFHDSPSSQIPDPSWYPSAYERSGCGPRYAGVRRRAPQFREQLVGTHAQRKQKNRPNAVKPNGRLLL